MHRPRRLAEPASTGSVTRSKWAALAVLSVAQLMVILDTTIVNVALPSIQKDLHFKSEADLQWVINAYVLTAGGFLLLGGRVADRYGRRLVFVSGIVVFAAASLSCGLANSPALLVGSRAVQGLGAAFMAPAALSLLTVIFAEGEERNRALGVWSAIAGAGGAVGLLAGGLLTTELSWRWVFFVNLPIAAVAVVASFRLIDESRNPVAGGFDVPGAVTGTAGLGALVFALVRANVWGWGSAQTLLVLAAAAVLLTTFVILQLRGRHPLVPRLFRSRTLVGADVGMLIAGAGLFAVFFFLTLYMQDLLHYSPLKTGIAYLPLSILLVMSAGVGSRILGRGRRPADPRDRVPPGSRRPGPARRASRPRAATSTCCRRSCSSAQGWVRPSSASRPRRWPGSPRRTPGWRPPCSTPASRSAGRSVWPSSPRWRQPVSTPSPHASRRRRRWRPPPPARCDAFIVGALLMVSAAVIGGVLLRPRPA